MLSCIVGEKSINSFDYEEIKLRTWSNKGILRCPECNDKVIYCNGDFKVPYFRHEVGSECSGNTYYEPMTNEHIEGIKILYERLKNIDGVENLEVEKYIKNTKQRPDIYFEYGGKKHCIEYQCSPISTQYNKRHELYQLEEINDIWILGTEKYGFEKYSDNLNYIEFSEKRIKAIEDEIDKGKNPLLYLNPNDNILYKINEDGFKSIHRWNSRYETFKEIILKTKVKVCLKKYMIDTIIMDDIKCKLNLPIEDIIYNTSKDIVEIENLLDNNYLNHVKFQYNLENDRFPIYKTNLMGNREFYSGCQHLKDFINEYIDFLNHVDKIVNKYNNGNYTYQIKGECIYIKNTYETYFDDSIIDIGYIVKEFKHGKYFYKFDIDLLDVTIKRAISNNKRMITKMKNDEIKRNIKSENLITLNKVVEHIDKKYCKVSGESIIISNGSLVKYIEFNMKELLDFKNTVDLVKGKMIELNKYSRNLKTYKGVIETIISRFNKNIRNISISPINISDKSINLNITLNKKHSTIITCYEESRSCIYIKISSGDCRFDLDSVEDINIFISEEIRRLRYGTV